MRSLIVLLSLAVAAGRIAVEDLPQYTFEKFVSEFHHDWKIGSEEWIHRKSLFEAEMSRVIAHNSKDSTWKQSVNSMSAMTPNERSAILGHSKNIGAAHKSSEYSVSPSTDNWKPVSSLPESVDWRENGVLSAVKDQGGCGSCWAFAATESIESHVAIATGKLFDLSPQQIAACTPNPDSCGGTGNCMGATCALAFHYVAGSAGMLEEYQYGYSSYYGVESDCAIPTSDRAAPKASIGGYVQLNNNYTELMNAVALEGPVALSVDASEWHNYDSGVFSGCNQENPDINHGVQLVGYGVDGDQKYWTVRNSWSASWGENGYIRLLRQDDEDVNNCGVDITPEDGNACAGDHTPVKTCGTCGMLFESSYPVGATLK